MLTFSMVDEKIRQLVFFFRCAFKKKFKNVGQIIILFRLIENTKSNDLVDHRTEI